MATLPLSILLLTDHSNEQLWRAISSCGAAAELVIGYHGPQVSRETLSRHIKFHMKHLSSHTHIQLVAIATPHPLENFSQARELIRTAATQEWCLWLDSDEVISGPSWLQIQKALATAQMTGSTAIECCRKDVFLQQILNYGDAVQWQVRLFKRQAGKFVGAVHEYVEVTGNTSRFPIVLLHSAHESITQFLAAVNYYTELLSRHKHTAWWHNILELFIYPPSKFVYMYCWQLGFLDGWRGLVYALVMSIHSLAVRVKIYEQSKHYER